MTNQEESKQLAEPKDLGKAVEEVSLEVLESLCSGFARRPRGCGSYSSVGENDDILF
ncbi:FlmA family RiPP peptide [Chitinophaga sancti]|uniref:Uncharacterized protein n=1 Tax=Chitinophaga sancti TaxID=1004 RepID=A0A1K1LRP4_9BACT|nr:hypothetical protein [Chitinophaga sancti]WQD64898.1 hypothetical protein U0033_10880 [Chitinophaga sancti]WQG89478.1 hypothetical protein SR876_31590 [Chitinophaga sancti]SFW13535.1 hypothetical protein SAMN05661012_00164 [Chitinophaga sancti]